MTPFVALALMVGSMQALPLAEPAAAESEPRLRAASDSVIEVPGGPTIRMRATPGSPLLGLRVSIPSPRTSEGLPWLAAERGLIDIGLTQASGPADLLGAQVTGRRTPGRIGFDVVGSSEDFETLAWILRRALATPNEEDFRRSMVREAERRDRLFETPQGRLQLHMEGTRDQPVPTWDSFQAARNRIVEPDSVRVFVLGDIPPPLVLAAFTSATEAADQRAIHAEPNRTPDPSVHSLLAWSAFYGRLGGTRQATTEVSAEVLRLRLSGATIDRATAQLFTLDAGGQTSIGLMTSARNRTNANRALNGLVELISQPVTETELLEAQNKVVARLVADHADPREWLLYADTHFPNGGLAQTLGNIRDVTPEAVDGVFNGVTETGGRWEPSR